MLSFSSVGMWLFFGLGFLTKGPPALLPLLPIVFWHFRQPERPILVTPFSILLFFIVGFGWYLLVCYRYPNLLQYFLGQEVVGRVASDSVHNHEWYKPFVIYLPVLSLGAGPWLYYGLKIFFREGLGHPQKVWTRLRTPGSSAFLLLWLLLPLIVLTLVRSRLPLYVLPFYAPIALAIARGLSKQKEQGTGSSTIVLITVLSAIALVGIKGIAAFYPTDRNMRSLYELCQNK